MVGRCGLNATLLPPGDTHPWAPDSIHRKRANVAHAKPDGEAPYIEYRTPSKITHKFLTALSGHADSYYD